MPYCKKCDRYFEFAEGLRQHRQNSRRHVFDSLTDALVRRVSHQLSQLPSRATASSSAMSFAQAARDTAGDEPSKDLISSLKGLYSSGEYSDLMISCRGKEYQVHRAIVCTQSEFLAAACRVGLKEAQEGKIDLPGDDPRLVHIMVRYLYHFDYDVKPQNEETNKDDETDANEPMRDVLVTHAKVIVPSPKLVVAVEVARQNDICSRPCSVPKPPD
ncbi:hypothetical protein QBC40DRAFT_61330 [Triangularia verruculosa]|uniref:BTB domain-containing protein n=1 Tax=Triangularia verruculosa TaxID=2587418 RepID=A0AAN6XIQ1_9PEZI|nr:hypothetical protein QBC40DRAFT_61330 [Triangularia verruculosa]